MNMRRPNGQIRAELYKGTLHTMSARWGDVIKAIPSNRWCTLEEIVQAVWEQEKKNFRRSFSRSRKQIEDAVGELVESTILIERA